MSYRCPNCKETVGLWEEMSVPGWRSVDADLKPLTDLDVDWHHAESEHQYGCGECGWGPRLKSALDELGIDGEPLPSIHRDQLSLTAAPHAGVGPLQAAAVARVEGTRND